MASLSPNFPCPSGDGAGRARRTTVSHESPHERQQHGIFLVGSSVDPDLRGRFKVAPALQAGRRGLAAEEVAPLKN